MSSSVQIAFDEPAGNEMVMTIGGGIRIEADGVEVTRLTDQDSYNDELVKDDPDRIWWYDYTGQPLDAKPEDFKGELFLKVTIGMFAENVLELARGTADRYDQLASDIGDAPDVLVVSYLDKVYERLHERVRVAYQPRQGVVGTKHNPTVEAAVGYAVPLDDLCLEVAQCLREFCDYAERTATDAESNPALDRYRDNADELEQLAHGKGE